MTVITSLTTTPVLSPLARPLKTASGHIERFPLVLVDLHTDTGVSGHAYAEIYLPELLPALESAILGLGQLVAGLELMPRDLYTYVLRRLRLWGAKNLAGVALGALDMAWWDAYARSRDEPLYKIRALRPLMWAVERTISTPATHRAHHALTNADGIGHYKGNFGNLLFFWDVLFGTAHITRRYPTEVGLRDDQLFGAERWDRQMFYPLLQSKREYSALKFGGKIYSDE